MHHASNTAPRGSPSRAGRSKCLRRPGWRTARLYGSAGRSSASGRPGVVENGPALRLPSIVHAVRQGHEPGARLLIKTADSGQCCHCHSSPKPRTMLTMHTMLSLHHVRGAQAPNPRSVSPAQALRPRTIMFAIALRGFPWTARLPPHRVRVDTWATHPWQPHNNQRPRDRHKNQGAGQAVLVHSLTHLARGTGKAPLLRLGLSQHYAQPARAPGRRDLRYSTHFLADGLGFAIRCPGGRASALAGCLPPGQGVSLVIACRIRWIPSRADRSALLLVCAVR